MSAAMMRKTIFAVVDGLEPAELASPDAVRSHLFGVIAQHGQAATDALEAYINLLVEEFCPAPHGM